MLIPRFVMGGMPCSLGGEEADGCIRVVGDAGGSGLSSSPCCCCCSISCCPSPLSPLPPRSLWLRRGGGWMDGGRGQIHTHETDGALGVVQSVRSAASWSGTD